MSRNLLRRIGVLILLLVLLAALAGFWAWQRYQAFAGIPVHGIEAPAALLVERGDSLPVVLAKLRALGVRGGHEAEWRLLAREMGAAGRLQVGEYAIDPGMTPRDILAALRDGRVVRHAFAIIPGRTFRELRAALARESLLEQEIEDLDDGAVMAALGQPDQHPEGRFLPETYHYTRGDSDLDLLRRAHAAMQEALDAAWATRSDDSVLGSPDELLTLASIVEKESGIASERPRVAGVFERRLRIGMKLQTDPTVIYGLGSAYDGNIRRRDLDTDTPYNTYTRGGLPPTPIAMPSAGALEATANPIDDGALYFVALGDGSGRHAFSRTLAEHNAAVARYLRRYRAAREADAGTAAGTGPESP